MNKKIVIMLLLIFVVSGCSIQGNSKKEIEALNKKISTLDTEVQELETKNTDLVEEIKILKESFDNYEYKEVISFKDIINIRVKVLQKQEGDDLYPYYIIVTQEDRDHNTPLLIAVDNLSDYEKFEKGNTYDLDVHVETVVDRTNNVIRFMYLLY